MTRKDDNLDHLCLMENVFLESIFMTSHVWLHFGKLHFLVKEKHKF